MHMSQIVRATTDNDILDVRQLFEEYVTSLGIDLGFQQVEQELISLPGAYSPPLGALFLARAGGTAVGCIGLRPFSESIGELKRLYVVPAFRGHGLARALVASAMAAARDADYKDLVLDTLSSMRSAIALYESFGFQPTEAYYPNPLPEALYFRLSLEPNSLP